MSTLTDIKIPLHSLIALLRREGYEIGTSAMLDLQRIVANIHNEDVQRAEDLKYLLAPIICRNKEEQQKFYKIFDEYLASINEHELVVKPEDETVVVKKKKWIWWLIIPLIIVVIGWIVSIIIYQKDKQVTLGIVEVNNRKANLEGDTVKLKVNYADSVQSKHYKTDWQLNGPNNFLQSFKNKKEISAVADSAGSYVAVASTFNKNGTLLKNDTSIVEVLCEVPPGLVIYSSSRTVNTDTGTFIATINDASPVDTAYKFHWFVNDVAVKGDTIMHTNLLKTTAQNIVRLKVDWPYKKLHCSVDSLSDELDMQPPLQLAVAGDPKSPLVLSKNYNWPNIFAGILGLLILPLVAGGLVKWRLKRGKHKKEIKNEVPEKEEAPTEYKGPFTIEFNKQQDKIMPEAGISQLAEVLRKRHTSDVFRLSISKTISSTIRKGGFPVLEYIPRTQPADFLILLDKEFPDGHLTNLFAYVIERLKKEQVHLLVYSFSREPLLLSNEGLNHILLPIDKVARLYPETMLIIFSQADAFFRSYDVILKKWVTEKFKSWNTKLIITPTAKKDWGAKELALYDAGFTVVPADMNAHTIISDEINHMIDRQLLKKEIVPEAYTSKQFNFSRWRQVTSYLKNAISENNRHFNVVTDLQLLEQWLCALAVYPHINWDVTIAIGKAFEDKYSRPGHLVNYTNLLILSRIQWMNDEQLMDSLRIEMMTHLEEDKQVLARAVIVELLKEIEPSVQADSLIKDEMQFLNTTNKFLLNAHDKTSHKLTEEELQQFKEYVENDQVDWTLETYLENGKNTLLKNPADPRQSVPLSQYLKTQAVQDTEAKKVQKLQPVRTVKDLLRKTAPAAVFIGVAIISYVLLHQTGKLKLTAQQLVDITFNISGDSLQSGLQVTNLSLLLNKSIYAATPSSKGSFIVKNVPIADSAAKLKLNIIAGEYETDFKLGNTRYTVDLKPFLIDTTQSKSVVSIDSLPPGLNEIWDVNDIFRTVAFYLNPKLFFYADKGITPSASVQIIEANLIEANTYRVILKPNTGSLYEVAFVRNITSTGMEWLRCRANTYNTIDEARRATYTTCGNFAKSQVSYTKGNVNNSSTTSFRIELPVNNVNLYRTELQKLRVAQKKFAGLPANEKTACTVVININKFNKSDREMLVRQAEILGSALTIEFSEAKMQNKNFNGNAFQRDYVMINFIASSGATNQPDCNRVFKSMEEALTVNPAVICNLDLSGKNLYNLPIEVYKFTSLKTLTLSGNYIPQSDLDRFKKSFPNCQVIDNNVSPQQQQQQQVPQLNKNMLDAVLKAALGEVKAGASKQ